MNVIICTDNKYLNDGHLCWIVNFLCCWWPEVQAMDTKFQLNGSSWNACVCSCPGYTNQLAFRKGDGSFAVYPHRQSSTWWGIQTGMNLWLNVCTSASNLHPDYECISRANEWNYTITASPLLSSQRLTAYVAKVFAMANSLVAVQRNVICDAVKFLIIKAQQPDGMFREVGKVYHGEMIVRALILLTSLF